MGASYSIVIRNPATNVKLWEGSNFLTLSYARAVNAVGRLSITFPSSVPWQILGEDQRIEVWRSIDGGLPTLDMGSCFFVRKRVRRTRGPTTIEAACGMDLLRRRIIAYAAGESQASKTDQADDMIKAIARENLSSSAVDTSRQISSTLFSVAADVAAGATITKAFAWDQVLTTAQEIAAASMTAGTYIAFDVIVNTSSLGLELQTYSGQRGQDRRISTGSGLIFSEETGLLVNAQLTDDWTGEVNYVYAGGQGEGTARTVLTAFDTDMINVSPFNRLEKFIGATESASSAAVQDKADSELRQFRPRRYLDASIAENQRARYGRDWGYGDFITAQFDGESFDARIDAIGITIDQSREERIDAIIRVEESL